MDDLIAAAANVAVGNPIPAPLQKGFMKAVGRLMGAAVDIPAAKMESYADEIRAATEARRALVLEAGKSLSENFIKDAPIVQRAQARAVSKILREQVNVEDIIGRTAEHLAASSADKEPGEIDEDWWNVFETEAVSKSSDDMKEIFSHILAGEISKPGSFSIKAIRTISALDKSVASSFNRLCSLALKSPYISKVLTLDKDAGGNGLIEYGLSFEVLSQLQEYGLIHVDYNAYMDYAGWVNFANAISYQKRPAVMVRLDGIEALTEFKLHGVTLSKVGRELYDIARITPSDEYSNSLSAFLRSKGHDLVFYDNQVVSPIVSTKPPTA